MCNAVPSDSTAIERTFAESRNTPSSVIPLWYMPPFRSQVNTPRSPGTGPPEAVSGPAPVLLYGYGIFIAYAP